MSELIKVVSLWKIYDSGNKRLVALQNINLSVKEGDYFVIVGPSGAGKTTLLSILGGLSYPTRGKIFFKGEDLFRFNEYKMALWRNRTIGFVFQFYHLIEELTVLENIVLPSLLNYKRAKTSFKAGRKLLQYLGIEEKATYVPSQLSGGEKQKVAIARALINEPPLIFCDEPTGNLDKESAEKIIALLEDLNTRKNKTLIIVTHNLELAKRTKKVVCIKNGVIVEECS